jgi:cell division protein FtsI (penicillin-binding protein 3)
VSNVLADSSDVGAIKIALRLGQERFYKYIQAFGFGQQTGIELPGETRGLAKPLNRWSKVSIGAISMGQEIGISPLQLIGMVGTIANDGVWVAPRVVATTAAAQSTPQMVVFHPAAQRRVLSPMTAAQMKQMMQGVVLHGTGTKAILEGYSAAGKTGTAQKVDPGTHGYSHSNYVASFAGFAPINNPAIAVAVILDSAKGLHQGGQIAAPVFQRVAQQVLEYLHTPHDVELPKSRELLLASQHMKKEDLEEGSPDHLGDALEVAAAADNGSSDIITRQNTKTDNNVVPAALRMLLPNPDPSIALAKSNEPPGTAPEKPGNRTVVLEVEQGGIIVPSFVGKTVRNTIEEAESAGLEVDAVGSGIARDQSPPAGAHVTAGATILVRFAR